MTSYIVIIVDKRSEKDECVHGSQIPTYFISAGLECSDTFIQTGKIIMQMFPEIPTNFNQSAYNIDN